MTEKDTTDPVLMQALLAMDSYNRGNDGLSLTGALGTAEFLGDPAKNGAFFAVAYRYNGQIVISYRGTDNSKILDSASDIWSGWLAGAGISDVSQVGQAIEFFKDIRSRYGENIVLTGHSLGGGLGGLVATIYGKGFFAFDNMPFRDAADDLQKRCKADSKLKEFIYGSGSILPLNDSSSRIGYYVSGESLSFVRGTSQFQPTEVQTGQLLWPVGGLKPRDRHSMSLLGSGPINFI